MSKSGRPKGFVRRATGVCGLDTLLLGGIFAGSVVIVQGPPGAGKTILANQMCFHHAKAGGKSIYMTLLAESHDRLLRLMKGLNFFDPSLVPSNVYYISAYDALMSDGPDGLLQLLTSETKRCAADLLVVDGLFVLEEAVASDAAFRRFVNDLSMLANLTDLTVVLLTNSRSPQPGPEHAMVDGWIDIDLTTADFRTYRQIEVRKFRGSEYVSGRHTMILGDDGITVFPRLESVIGGNPAPGVLAGRLGTGIAELDTMTGGGLPRASTTLVVGATGAGKTTLGLHFLSPCSKDEPGLFFAFFETAERLRLRADGFGLAFGQACDGGSVEVQWHPPVETLIDRLGYQIIDSVARRKVRRLVVDGVDGLALSIIHARRLGSFFAALTNTLRDLDVTTLYTLELSHLIAAPSAVFVSSLSALAENVVVLRYHEREGRVHRLISLLKVRESAFDPAIREYAIGTRGIRIGEPAPYMGGAAPAGPYNILPWDVSHG